MTRIVLAVPHAYPPGKRILRHSHPYDKAALTLASRMGEFLGTELNPLPIIAGMVAGEIAKHVVPKVAEAIKEQISRKNEKEANPRGHLLFVGDVPRYHRDLNRPSDHRKFMPLFHAKILRELRSGDIFVDVHSYGRRAGAWNQYDFVFVYHEKPHKGPSFAAAKNLVESGFKVLHDSSKVFAYLPILAQSRGAISVTIEMNEAMLRHPWKMKRAAKAIVIGLGE